jgi:predicted DNA-binding antitoxin AbrB/MazE fold protein
MCYNGKNAKIKLGGKYFMYAIKAIYDGINFKPVQPIPVKENYEVVITFVEPLKKDQKGIMDFAGIWEDESALDLDEIMAERKNFSLGRMEDDDIS